MALARIGQPRATGASRAHIKVQWLSYAVRCSSPVPRACHAGRRRLDRSVTRPDDGCRGEGGMARHNGCMAQRVEIQLIDDVDGTAATQTVRFALNGRELEIDLNDKNASKLRKALDPYVGAARRLGSATGTSRRRTLAASSSGMTKQELGNVRAWARSNGYEVADRGRIKSDIIEAYHAAQ
jgi:hypothetical protein